jgi:PII-like signaling protein
MEKEFDKKKVLRIYLDSTDRYDGEPLWLKLLEKARDEGVDGATVFKGAAGIGVHTEVHMRDIWSLSQKLPVIIEMVDERERLLRFLEKYESIIGEGMVTMSDVEVLRYGTPNMEI